MKFLLDVDETIWKKFKSKAAAEGIKLNVLIVSLIMKWLKMGKEGAE